MGKDAARILETIGVHVPDTCRLAICEVPADHPFVLVEQMMPVLPIVRCQSFEQAVEDAVVAEHGNRHTASIFSKDVDHMTRFARVIETTIYVKNSATKAGVGIGGEGHCTMTIAGPTGEGITCAKSFCRRRRCMLAEGGCASSEFLKDETITYNFFSVLTGGTTYESSGFYRDEGSGWQHRRYRCNAEGC